ncbi:Nuclease-related domain protein [compost metagenome]
MLASLIPTLISLLPMVVSIAILYVLASGIVFYQQKKNKHRHSPLTSKLLRGPGHALVKKLEDINFDIAANFFLIWFIPVFIFAMHVSVPYFLERQQSPITVAIHILAVIGLEIYVVLKLIKITNQRRRIREGYEAESAVGSELSLLMHDGAYVFHDLQAENFNIDHVIVSPAGVFCVETKSRVKYSELNGKQNARMEFDGKTLHFPSHKETEPVEQVRRNAKWLKDWLSKTTGSLVDVRPVLAFPGWFVTSSNRSDVLVINGKNVSGMFKNATTKTPLDSSKMQSIAYQIEQRCRDIEPINYKKSAKTFAPQ